MHRLILKLVFWYISSFVLPNQNEISFPNGRVNLLLNTPCWKTNDVLFFYNRYPCLQANRIKHDPSCCDDPEKLRTFLRQKNYLTTTIWHIFCFVLLMKKIEILRKILDNHQTWWWLTTGVTGPPKGQLISTCLFGIFNSSKKRTKKFNFTNMVRQVELILFFFWENWRHQKYIFELTDL